MRALAWLPLLALSPAVARAQTLPEDFEKKVDALCAPWSRPGVPGGVVAVAQEGKMLFVKGYGLANVETGTPIVRETVFDVGSVSKQFTAVCVLLMEEDGLIKTSDPITKYFPEVPTFGKEVTIDHLLRMTSGLRDYLNVWVVEGWWFTEERGFEDVVQTLARQQGLNSDPGEKFNYCNAGYALMAMLVERTTGKSLATYAKERVFDPLGMKDTFFMDDDSMVVPRRALSYSPSEAGKLENLWSPMAIYGDGGVHTTVDDLLKWHENFYANKLGKADPALMEKMVSTKPLNSGQPNGYACGLFVGELDGVRRIEHGGNWLDYAAATARFPEKRLSVFVLSNAGDNGSGRVSDGVARLVLGTKEAEQTEIKLTEEQLKPLVGTFNLPDGRVLETKATGPQLTAQVTGQPAFPIYPESPTKFFFKVVKASIEFKLGEDGKATGATLRQGGATIELTAGAPFAPTDEHIKALAGTYESFEVGSTVTLIARDGKLFVRRGDDPEETEVTLRSPDAGSLAPYSFKVFRDAQGKVRGFTLDAIRAQGLRFVKRG
jgi:CubicO group peptidase (beta-lactamase class C family)